jgi:hypothetical protein
MSVEVGQPVAAAATTQFKLFPYDEEEPAIWFRLKGPVRRTGIKSEKLKYAKALANLSKQVLQEIWTQSLPAMSQISCLTSENNHRKRLEE